MRAVSVVAIDGTRQATEASTLATARGWAQLACFVRAAELEEATCVINRVSV
jgi:hypothetical protein